MTNLTPDQVRGSQALAGWIVGYLADVPGLGKTAQYLRAIDLVGADSAIIVCPPILRAKIPDESALWSLWGQTIHVIESSKDPIPADGIAVVSYNAASNPVVLAKLLARKPGPLILDEAHRVKNADAACTEACLGHLAQRATHVWFVSGTPMPNHAGELFPFAKLAGLWPGTWADWLKAYCVTVPDPFDRSKRKVTGSRNLDELRTLIMQRMIRRSIVEGRPPLTVDTLTVEGTDAYASLDPERQELIKAAALSGMWSFEDEEALSTERRLIGLAKVQGTIELAREVMESGHRRLLIFGTHVDVLEAITEGLRDYGAELINGATSARTADAITRAFQNDDGRQRIIAGNMTKMGEAVTLTAASRGLIAEPAWTPKDNEQVIARAWRRGQLHPVHFSLIAIAGSIDEAITRTVARKAGQIAQVIG